MRSRSASIGRGGLRTGGGHPGVARDGRVAAAMSETRSKTATVRNRFRHARRGWRLRWGWSLWSAAVRAAASIGGGAGRSRAVLGQRLRHAEGQGAWKRKGNYKTVIMLDGMRPVRLQRLGRSTPTSRRWSAPASTSWSRSVARRASSTNRDAPSNFNNQPFQGMWNCVITNTLIKALDRRGYRVGKSRRYAIMGLDGWGNAALTIGAQNRQHFDRAGSLSGYTWLSAPGMRTMIRLAMLDVAPRPWNVGFDVADLGPAVVPERPDVEHRPHARYEDLHRIGQWPVRPLQRPAQRLRRPVQGSTLEFWRSPRPRPSQRPPPCRACR